MRVFLTGGTGLIGGRLISKLVERGDEVVALTRRAEARFPIGCKGVLGDPVARGPWLDELAQCEVVIHLAGEPVMARRWRASFREKIRTSRVDSTRLISEEMARNPRRADGSPRVLVNASGIGYYGLHDAEPFDELSPPGTDFLAGVCREWEAATTTASQAGVRVVVMRTGLVLDDAGGALPKMARPFRWFIGGPIGHGKQWMSWIHRDDLLGIILMAMDNPEARGPINAVAPEPVTNWGFAKMIGKVLRRPSALFVPRWVLYLLLGRRAAMVTQGQRAIPARAVQLGYTFQFEELEPALRNLWKR